MGSIVVTMWLFSRCRISLLVSHYIIAPSNENHVILKSYRVIIPKDVGFD